jgi:LuxR family maltose regulon positive regulatory protein
MASPLSQHAAPAQASSDLRSSEPDTDRELEVLRLLGSTLGGRDIARELSVSLNTVRTYTTHI